MLFRLDFKRGLENTAADHVGYICRTGRYGYGKKAEELVHWEAASLPSWAKRPADFFEAADTFEKTGGRAYCEVTLALQNELTESQNIELVRKFIHCYIGDDKVIVWAYHSKVSAFSENIMQPHAHIMWNERCIDNNRPEPDNQLFFMRYCPYHPERGGYRKDRRYSSKSSNAIKTARQGWQDIINNKFEELNLPGRVSCKSLKDQYADALATGDMLLAEYLDRDQSTYLSPKATWKMQQLIKDRDIDLLDYKSIIKQRDISPYLKYAMLQIGKRKLSKLLLQTKSGDSSDLTKLSRFLNIEKMEIPDFLKAEAEKNKNQSTEKETATLSDTKNEYASFEEIRDAIADFGNALLERSDTNNSYISLYNKIYTNEKLQKQIALAVVTKGKSKRYSRHLQKIAAAQRELENLIASQADKEQIDRLSSEITKAMKQAHDMREYLNYHTKKSKVVKVISKLLVNKKKRQGQALSLQACNEEFPDIHKLIIYILQILKKDKDYPVTHFEAEQLQKSALLIRQENYLAPNNSSVEICISKAKLLLKNLTNKIKIANKSKSLSRPAHPKEANPEYQI